MRIKTKLEFEKEFGEQWRISVTYSFPERMNWILGKTLDGEQETRFNTGLHNIFFEEHEYYISKEMLVSRGLRFNKIKEQLCS